MTESKLNSGRPENGAAKRPWATPRIIASELASRSQATGTTPPNPADHHGTASTSFGGS